MHSSEQLQHGLSAHGALVDPDYLRNALNPVQHGHRTRFVFKSLRWGDVAALLAVCLCDLLVVAPQLFR